MAAGLLLIRLSGLHAEYSEFAEGDEEDVDYEDDNAGGFDEDKSVSVADDVVSEDEPR
ncbi:hypothetical protein [Brevibacterium sp. JSBI002]|uniref:hypothetical protein n=1 Tax=Brevibacterium sp. JSBI002 TaxID=2886045 RepID=UPI00222E0EB6|nr:hypothetical protein [Brevibacterium sp. JSBI002]UZD63235.1 hypothetical protein LJ362_05180 [Brevibacterium sp. JSBI002]